MNDKAYPIELSEGNYQYRFNSVGVRTEVKKVVSFNPTKRPNMFNLVLFDVMEDGSLSDISETPNGDMRTVLATVINILSAFLKDNPEAGVLFRRGDKRRHRLYSIIIAREQSAFEGLFDIFGLNDNKPELFKINREYEYFLIYKK